MHQVNTAYSFKQLCEQSDQNLRQYLGKPLNPKQCKEEESQHVDLYNSSLLLDNFGMDDSSNDSDDDFRQDFGLLEGGISDNPNDEKAIAQRQLLKAAKMQKHKISKKKLLTKNGSVYLSFCFHSLLLNCFYSYFIEKNETQCESMQRL